MKIVKYAKTKLFKKLTIIALWKKASDQIARAIVKARPYKSKIRILSESGEERWIGF